MKALQKKHRGQEGFTLLEIMIALAIISISLVVLIHSQGVNISTCLKADNAAKAAMIGQTVIESGNLGEALMAGKSEGEEMFGDIKFLWEIRIEPSPFEGINKITVQVFREGDNKNKLFTIESYRTI